MAYGFHGSYSISEPMLHARQAHRPIPAVAAGAPRRRYSSQAIPATDSTLMSAMPTAVPPPWPSSRTGTASRSKCIGPGWFTVSCV